MKMSFPCMERCCLFGFLSFSTLRRIEDARELLCKDGDLGLAPTCGCLLLAAVFPSSSDLSPSSPHWCSSPLSVRSPTSRLCAHTQPLAFQPGNVG